MIRTRGTARHRYVMQVEVRRKVHKVATDYDTPRKTDEELHEESLEELKAQRV